MRNGSRSLIGKHAQIKRFMPNTVIGAFMTGVRSECPSFTNALLNTTHFDEEVSKNMGATINQITGYMFSKMEFKVPSLEEQNKIGAYFEQLDHLITLHQCKESAFSEWKDSSFLQKHKTTWEQRKLSEIATMHARIGWQNLRTSEFLDSGNYMLITGTDFEDGAINFDTCHYVERERYEQDKHIQIKNGSILITKDGTLGKVAYVQGLSMPATLNAGVFNVEIKDETKVDNKYLFQYLKAPYLMDYVDKKATGGTIKHLNQNILVDFPVVMPLKQEQRLIGAYFNQLDHLITLHQRKPFCINRRQKWKQTIKMRNCSANIMQNGFQYIRKGR